MRDVRRVGPAESGRDMTFGIEPPSEAFEEVGVFASEHDAQVSLARNYPGPEHFVKVERRGQYTWVTLVATDGAAPDA